MNLISPHHNSPEIQSMTRAYMGCLLWTDVDSSGDDWGICAVSGLFAMRGTVRLMIYKPESSTC